MYEYNLGPLESIPPEIPLECKEPTENGQFCIFHDKSHYIEQKAAKRFEEKLRESINQNKPLLCFGYDLPETYRKYLLSSSLTIQQLWLNHY